MSDSQTSNNHDLDEEIPVPVTAPTQETVQDSEAFNEGLPGAAEVVNPDTGQVETAYDPERHDRSPSEG